MKTYNNLWDSFISQDNWQLAYETARKGKKDWHSVKRFNEEHLQKLREETIEGRYHTSPYREKIIYEPKKRTIYKLPFRDRIVHHAVMNVLRPIFTPLLTDTCYACIEDRGPHKASLKCAELTRKYKYCLKCDIRKFYPSITHSILIKMMERIIKDKKFMAVLREIICSFPGEVNVPIGNYTSQWLGNFYLIALDNFIKHTIRIGAYIRYCDDFLLFSNDKKELNRAKYLIGAFLKEVLNLSFSKADVFDVKQGVDFCGYRHFKEYVIMRKSSARKWLRRKPKKEAMASFYGQSRRCKSWNLRKAMVARLPVEWVHERSLLLHGPRHKSFLPLYIKQVGVSRCGNQ